MSVAKNQNDRPNPKSLAATPLRARDLMERGVRTVDPETTIARLAEVFDEEGVSGLPVIDKRGRLVGVVTKTDIARAFAESSEDRGPGSSRSIFSDSEEDTDLELEDTLHGDEIRLTARTLMSTNVVTAGEDETASDLAARMLEHGIHRVIVTRRDEVLGVVSSFDLLRAIVEYESMLTIH